MNTTTTIIFGIILAFLIASICMFGEKDPEEDEDQMEYIKKWKEKHEKDV